jgi:hypothetical protein
MRLLFRAGVLALAGVGAKSMYDKYLAGTHPDSQLLPAGPIEVRGTIGTAAPPVRDQALGQAVAT